jgi:murein DD-endopeptidase MepM/ murein hydrolase activator NlpD
MEKILQSQTPISMKNFTYLAIFLSLFALSCGSPASHLFGKRTAHEKYEDSLKDTGVADTPEGKQWLAASQASLSLAHPITIPYTLNGYFDPAVPRALGLSFQAKQGELVDFLLKKQAGTRLYAAIFRWDGTEYTAIASAEPDEASLQFEVEQGGQYVLRLQPAIGSAASYELEVRALPSLGFPVAGTRARVGSVWGDPRDGGKRLHEGIDIFAAKKTPVIAAADGYISSVKEGGLGGKTVNLRPAGKRYSLYYAHLDEQLVTTGQYVKKGDTIGTVGNTGNARTTPPHLHFGIYGYGGAVDPLPFVNRSQKKLVDVPPRQLAGNYLQVTKSAKASGATFKPQDRLIPLAVTASGYIAEDAYGKQLLAPFNVVKMVPVSRQASAVRVEGSAG